jgi:D-alanyl-lipoteichoic acid acyltransferase DltB (MBOAT superfamily)
MQFDSALYIWFLATVFVVWWAVARFATLRLLWILLVSYAFYAAWNPQLLLLIIASTFLDWAVALWLGRAENVRTRKLLLAASLVANLGLLSLFKYGNFVLQSLQAASDALDAGIQFPVLHLILPVGISFYTFQTLSYTIDVYRRRLDPVPSLLRFATFVVFFPQLVAGPIVRASDLLPQLALPPRLDHHAHARGLVLIALGLVKKMAFADWLALNLVDRVFDNPELYSSVEILFAVYGYAIQIYCDFSGYSDIAIGSALLFGFTLPANFDRPYAAVNLQDFWHRWHISLSTWLRDYLYVPLGGNRHGSTRTYVNLFITMLLGGLWHGAAWTFVVWGVLHGIGLGATRWWQRRRPAEHASGGARRWLGIVLTFHFVCFCWIFFRASDFANAFAILEGLSGLTTYIPNLSAAALGTIALAIVLHWAPRSIEFRVLDRVASAPSWVLAVLAVIVAVVLQHLRGSSPAPFIYFQF